MESIVEEDGTVTGIFRKGEMGDEGAVTSLWELYFDRMKQVAARRYEGIPLRVSDEEDAAVGAFAIFFRKMRTRKLKIENREDLWRFLSRITRDHVVDTIRSMTALRRGGGQVRGDSVVISSDGFDAFPQKASAPDEVFSLREIHDEMLSLLPSDQIRTIASRRIEGYTNSDIAEELKVSERSIERKMQLVRKAWCKCQGSDGDG